jgi:hypothetical protein
MPVQRISFSIVWLIFSLKLLWPTVLAPLSIFSALHKFQATAIEAGIAAPEDWVPPEVLSTPQGIDTDNKSSIFARWHVA